MIRTLLLIIAVTAIATLSKAQNSDSVEVRAKYGSDISDVQLLMELEKIDYYKVFFKHAFTDSSYFFLTVKEYWNGKVTKRDTLMPKEYALEYFSLAKADTSTVLSLITKPAGDSVVFNFRFSGLSMTTKYRRIKSNEYSLRDGLATNEKFKKIPINHTLPLFVYSLPYKNPKQPEKAF